MSIRQIWKPCPQCGSAVGAFATEEAEALRAELFAAKIRIEELRAVLMEALPMLGGTIGEERPVVAVKVKAALEGGE